MLAGVQEILIITTPKDQNQFIELLGDGSRFGVSIEYSVQNDPNGLAEALIIGEDFLAGSDCLFILGDNLFHGAGLGRDLNKSFPESGAHVFTYEVSNPEQYGVLELDSNGHPLSIMEKPKNSLSNLAVTGLYYFDKDASTFARQVIPSNRGELEITSVLEMYLVQGNLTFTHLSRGSVWLDTGTINNLHDASTYVKVIEERTGLQVGCLEEIAFRNDWISLKHFNQVIEENKKNDYGKYLRNLKIG
jgi:glucose-1-phosphate thymidylyltransferase